LFRTALVVEKFLRKMLWTKNFEAILANFLKINLSNGDFGMEWTYQLPASWKQFTKMFLPK
jgi:hypothetical protein